MDSNNAVHRPGGTWNLEHSMNTKFDITRVSAKAFAAINAAKPMSREYGEAVAQAWIEATTPVAEKQCDADIVNEYLASHKVEVKFWLGQAVSYLGTKARILKVARNGIWITRWPTEGEVMMRNLEIVKERVPARYLTPLAS